MFRPSENGNELFRRLKSGQFDFRVGSDKVERLPFGATIEVQARCADITECILRSAVSFADQNEKGIIFHVSVGGSLFNFLLQSRINITTTPLYQMHCEERVKAIQVSSLLHLMATLEFIKLSANGEKTLVLLDGLTGLFLAQKANTILSPSDGLIANVFKSLQSLISSQMVVVIWVNSVTPKHVSSLRDGPGANKDALNILWKQNVPKVVQYMA